MKGFLSLRDNGLRGYRGAYDALNGARGGISPFWGNGIRGYLGIDGVWDGTRGYLFPG